MAAPWRRASLTKEDRFTLVRVDPADTVGAKSGQRSDGSPGTGERNR